MNSRHVNKEHFQDKHTNTPYDSNKLVSDQEKKQTHLYIYMYTYI